MDGSEADGPTGVLRAVLGDELVGDLVARAPRHVNDDELGDVTLVHGGTVLLGPGLTAADAVLDALGHGLGAAVLGEVAVGVPVGNASGRIVGHVWSSVSGLGVSS